MNGIAIAPLHNKEGRHDATGAFQLGAKIFTKLHKLPKPIIFNNHSTKPPVSTLFLNHLDSAAGGWDVFAYFGHGGSKSLPSAEISGRSGAALLAKSILPKANRGIKVLLYACNTGDPGGFAEWLATELARVKATVYAHVPPPGHSFTNANVVYYPGGNWVVPKSHRLWGDWYHDMKSLKNDLWARFPFMSQHELEAELDAPEFLLGRWNVRDKVGSWDVVFFGDKTAVRTDPLLRYRVSDRGAWTATKRVLTVTWGSGGAESWPLPLSLKGQNVTPGGGAGPGGLKADRTETLEFNPRGLFSGGTITALMSQAGLRG